MYPRISSESALAKSIGLLTPVPSLSSFEDVLEEDRSVLHFESIPSCVTVTVDGQQFSHPFPRTFFLSPAMLHLVTVVSNSLSKPNMLFFRTEPCESLILSCSSESYSLSIEREEDSSSQAYMGSSQNEFPTLEDERHWDSLTNFIDDTVLATLGIKPGLMPSSSYFAPLPAHSRPRALSVPDLANFSEISSSENEDTAPLVRTLVKRRYSGNGYRLFGEIQLAYLSISKLGCMDAMEHWTTLLSLAGRMHTNGNSSDADVSWLANMLTAQFSDMSPEVCQKVVSRDVRKCLARFISVNWKSNAVMDLTKTLSKLIAHSDAASREDSDLSGDSEGSESN